MGSNPHSVFVYGTLKAGQANHGCLAGATFHGRRRLVGGHLHDLGAYPMAVLNPGGDATLHGELYAVDDEGLARLDRLEEVPGYYDRSLQRLSDGSEAWIYHGRAEQVRRAPLLRLGDWGTTPVLHYGSNLDPGRLATRCPRWDGQGFAAVLPDWRWALDKLGRDGTGKAGIQPSPGSSTWGVITHLTAADLEKLDVCEGVSGGHYRRTVVRVRSHCGAAFEALTYVPGDGFRRPGLRPDSDYLGLILSGLDHWDLPATWRSAVLRHGVGGGDAGELR